LIVSHDAAGEERLQRLLIVDQAALHLAREHVEHAQNWST
jgi:hypothetical protein